MPATELGVSQQSISRIEQSETVEEDKLQQIAQLLGVTAEAIKNFSEEAVFNYFNKFNDSSASNGAFYAQTFNFNPIEKWLEVVEENKKLYAEKVALQERLLKAKQEKNELLQSQIGLGLAA